jgi:hypothetical protein
MTSELEARLVALGHELEWPPTPSLAADASERLREQPPTAPPRRRWRPARRILIAAPALLLVGAGAGMAASPEFRDDVLRFFHLKGAEIVRVRRLPPIPPKHTAGLGMPVSLAQVRAKAGFAPLVPTSHGWTGYLHDGELTLKRGRLLVSELRGATRRIYVFKEIAPGTTVRQVTVRGVGGWWIAGKPHEFAYESPNGTIRLKTLRLAGNTLLWNEQTLLVRIEGAVNLGEALRTASSLRR